MELFHSLFDWYMANLNYFTVALLMAIESTFLPLPSEVVIPFAAYKAGSRILNGRRCGPIGKSGARECRSKARGRHKLPGRIARLLSYYAGQVQRYIAYTGSNSAAGVEHGNAPQTSDGLCDGLLLPLLRHSNR